MCNAKLKALKKNNRNEVKRQRNGENKTSENTLEELNKE